MKDKHTNKQKQYEHLTTINTKTSSVAFGWELIWFTNYDRLMLLSTMFNIYHAGEFYWWRNPEFPKKNTDVSWITDKLNQTMLHPLHLTIDVTQTHSINRCKFNMLRMPLIWIPSSIKLKEEFMIIVILSQNLPWINRFTWYPFHTLTQLQKCTIQVQLRLIMEFYWTFWFLTNE